MKKKPYGDLRNSSSQVAREVYAAFLFCGRFALGAHDVEQVAGLDHDGAVGRAAEYILFAVSEDVAQPVVVASFQQEVSGFRVLTSMPSPAVMPYSNLFFTGIEPVF